MFTLFTKTEGRNKAELTIGEDALAELPFLNPKGRGNKGSNKNENKTRTLLLRPYGLALATYVDRSCSLPKDHSTCSLRLVGSHADQDKKANIDPVSLVGYQRTAVVCWAALPVAVPLGLLTKVMQCLAKTVAPYGGYKEPKINRKQLLLEKRIGSFFGQGLTQFLKKELRALGKQQER